MVAASARARAQTAARFTDSAERSGEQRTPLVACRTFQLRMLRVIGDETRQALMKLLEKPEWIVAEPE